MNVYEIATNKIVEQLEKGVVPWHRPWYACRPQNWVTGKRYNGINIFVLKGGEYLTYKQCKAAGGTVRHGEKGHPVFFFSFIDKEDDSDGEDEKKMKSVPIFKYYTVFEVSQCDGIERKEKGDGTLDDFKPIETAENIIAGYADKPEIKNTSPYAAYNKGDDIVYMPPKELFKTELRYYSTLFHELGHSTGAKNRLNRDLSGMSGSKDYAREELVAELTSSMLVTECRLCNNEDVYEQSAAYIKGWIEKLNNDSRAFVFAASRAKKAYEYILGLKINSVTA